ncbi:Pectinesterase [Actinidia chinensis var. chinensis]|uniref:Pectinesterase n=1 Tax=Actinidia chinensis var. chinensis TaxID=1590841 RepID=A0A2R6PVQ6_ACTCC|nr:Pectinesterase [Actinidia chinensis var. chinensis]
MTFSCCSSSLFVSLTLVILFISLSSEMPRVKAENDLINKYVPTLSNASRCLQVLKSDPRSASADLKGLGKISINKAKASAKQTSKLIASLKICATDSILKGQYGLCSQDYSDAFNSLEEAKRFLKFGDYVNFGIYAAAAFGGAEELFEEGPPDQPNQLWPADQELKDLCDIVKVLSSRLCGLT